MLHTHFTWSGLGNGIFLAFGQLSVRGSFSKYFQVSGGKLIGLQNKDPVYIPKFVQHCKTIKTLRLLGGSRGFYNDMCPVSREKNNFLF